MGNCIAPSTTKLVSTEARGGLNEQPRLPVGDNKNGPDEHKRQGKEDFNSSKPAVPCKNSTGGGNIVRVKLVLTKQELVELLSNGLAEGAAMEDLLVELQAKLSHQSATVIYNPCQQNCDNATSMSSPSGWRPSLESIPED